MTPTRWLKANWANLPDVDRAAAICSILNKEGDGQKCSGRKLALQLGYSEALLRHIKPLVHATELEKEAAREGRITTRKLLALIKERHRAKARVSEENAVAARERAGVRGGEEIIAFLRKEGVVPAVAEQIWAQALAIVRKWEQEGRLANIQRPKKLTTAQIASRCWPAFAPNGDGHIAYINCYSYWLARWTCYAMPNSEVRERGFEWAWCQIIRPYRLTT